MQFITINNHNIYSITPTSCANERAKSLAAWGGRGGGSNISWVPIDGLQLLQGDETVPNCRVSYPYCKYGLWRRTLLHLSSSKPSIK